MNEFEKTEAQVKVKLGNFAKMSELRKKMKCTLKSDDTNLKIKKDPVEEYLLV